MSEHAVYPQSLPKHCIAEVIRIVRAGRISEERAAFALHAWNVQGYLQSIVLGDGEQPPLIGATAELAGVIPEPAEPAKELTDDEACDHLLAIETGVPAVKGSLPVPVALLLRWVVRKLVERLI